MYSIATHLISLKTLGSHPAEFAKKHRESPEVQSFKQNPSKESMVAYIASKTLTHSEIVPEDEQVYDRRRPRPNILDDEDEEEDDHEPFNTPESSAEHTLFIT